MKATFYIVLLLELVVYLGLWLFDDYLAFYLSLIFGGIALMLYLFSVVVERIERSNVPRWYYQIYIASIIAPIIAWGIFSLLVGEVVFDKIG